MRIGYQLGSYKRVEPIDLFSYSIINAGDVALEFNLSSTCLANCDGFFDVVCRLVSSSSCPADKNTFTNQFRWYSDGRKSGLESC